jgi:hypothetical protein
MATASLASSKAKVRASATGCGQLHVPRLDACVFTPITQFWTPALEWWALFPAGQS